MNKNILIKSILVWLLSFGLAFSAVEDQFYFIGKIAPKGSISKSQINTDVLYLRWDVVEGSLPDDLEHFILKADNQEIDQFEVNPKIEISDVKNLYDQDGQERRKLETINNLVELNKASETPVDENEIKNNYGEYLIENLEDNYWSMLASKNDINIAILRNRATVLEVPKDKTQYTLYGVSTSKEETVLGQITIIPDEKSILSAANSFSQIDRIGRCDAPESYKDHYTIYLKWQNPGDNTLEQYAHILFSNGYDLYLSEEKNYGGSSDIRNISSSLNHDEFGNVKINGLIKLNDQPILVSGNSDKEEIYKAWNPDYANYMISPDVLKNLGLKPGDQRIAILASRDFTGNYGESVKIVVTVPDLTKPPSPWEIWYTTDMNSENEKFKLKWLNTDLNNYYKAFNHNRKFCNLETAKDDNKLIFSFSPEGCDKQNLSVSLNPKEYLIYRFDNLSDAQKFKDTDGDGYSDIDEQTKTTINNKEYILPGSSCEYNGTLLGKTNYLVSTLSSDAALNTEVGKVLELVDNEPAKEENKSTYFWYKIAVKDYNGEISSLSEPIRVLYKDRELPNRPKPGDGFVFGTKECVYNIETIQENSAFVKDDSDDAYFISISEEKPNADDNFKNMYRVEKYDDLRGVKLSKEQCEELKSSIKESYNLKFYNEYGSILAQSTFYNMNCDMPNINKAVLKKNCTQNVDSIPNSDMFLEPPFLFSFDNLGDNCAKITQMFDGESQTIQTVCPDENGKAIAEINPNVSIGGQRTCFGVEYTTQNSINSLIYNLPCIQIPAKKAPDTPNATHMIFQSNTNMAQIAWALSSEELTGALVKWYNKEKITDAKVKFFPVKDNSELNNGIYEESIEIDLWPGNGNWSEEWCVEVQSVSKYGQGANKTSSWSTPVCSIRQPEGVSKKYLPWPKIKAPKKLNDVQAIYIHNKYPLVKLAKSFPWDGDTLLNIPQLNFSNGEYSLIEEQGGDYHSTNEEYCSLVNSSIGDKFDFVVYRQSSKDDPETGAIPSEFRQVSPLVESIYCYKKIIYSANDKIDPLPTWTLDDPLFMIVNDSGNYQIYFKDSFPHQTEKWYRYQIVYFQSGEIIGFDETNWLEAN